MCIRVISVFLLLASGFVLASGPDMRYVQEMLGHEDLNTTQRYTHVVINDLKKYISKLIRLRIETKALIPIWIGLPIIWKSR